MTNPGVPFPAERLYLSQRLLEPAFSDDGRSLFVVRQHNGQSALLRLQLASGLLETLTTEPSPSAALLYGGGLYSIRGQLLVYPSRDGRLHALDLASARSWPLTPAFDALGAPALSPCGRFIACAAEEQNHGLVFVASLDSQELVRMPGCQPFCCDPIWGPEGRTLSWQTWQADTMPWEQSELRVASFAAPLSHCNRLSQALPVSLQTLVRPACQLAFPLPHPDGQRLFYVSDENGMRSPWCWNLQHSATEPVGLLDDEVGTPNWVQRMMPMALGCAGRRLYAIGRRDGLSQLWSIDLANGARTVLPSAYSSMTGLCVWDGGGSQPDRIGYLGSTPSDPLVLITREYMDETSPSEEVVRMTSALGLWDRKQLAKVTRVRWKTEQAIEVCGIWTQAKTSGPAPLIVWIHGGPTSCAELSYDPMAQFFATRGYHFLAVNYRGSTQRGRAYQDMLRGNWGLVDVQDAYEGAQTLVAQGQVDPSRMAIMGASSGGYTALLALSQQPEVWAAGVSLYGLSDLYEAMRGSHRFEQHYQDILVGPLPEAADTWRERSPLTHAQKVKAAVLLFHGTQDKAVPYQQSVSFAQALQRKGGVAELVTYEGEGHGFRQSKNQKDMLERIHAFLEKYVRFRQGPAR